MHDKHITDALMMFGVLNAREIAEKLVLREIDLSPEFIANRLYKLAKAGRVREATVSAAENVAAENEKTLRYYKI